MIMMKAVCRLLLATVIVSSWLPANAENDFERACSTLTGESLPQVNLTLDESRMTKETYIDGHIDIADPLARTTGEVLCSFDCRLHWRGATSLHYDKKSIAVKVVDEDGEELNVNMLGIRKKENWILDAMAIDGARMRNRVLFDLWNEMSGTPWQTDYGQRNGTLGHFVEVYFNGDYHGLYCLTDKIDRKLLGLKKAKENGDEVTVRGLQYKCVSHSKACYLSDYDATASVDATTWNGYELKVPEDYPSLATWQPLMDIIDTCKLRASRLGECYEEFFYRENLVDYMVFVLAFRITDNSLKNTYLSTPDITQNKRFIITPWDLDASLGNSWQGVWQGEMTSMKFLSVVQLYNKLYNYNPDFRQAFKARWCELRHTIFSCQNLKLKMSKYADMLKASGAWERERAKWNNNPVPMLEDLHGEVDRVCGWYDLNMEYMNELLKTPWGDVNGDEVVSGADVTALYSVLLDGATPAGDADVNGDGFVNGADVTALYNLLLEQ